MEPNYVPFEAIERVEPPMEPEPAPAPEHVHEPAPAPAPEPVPAPEPHVYDEVVDDDSSEAQVVVHCGARDEGKNVDMANAIEDARDAVRARAAAVALATDVAREAAAAAVKEALTAALDEVKRDIFQTVTSEVGELLDGVETVVKDEIRTSFVSEFKDVNAELAEAVRKLTRLARQLQPPPPRRANEMAIKAPPLPSIFDADF